MNTAEFNECLTTLFSELVNGAAAAGDAFIVNPGDVGLLQSLDKLSAADASRSSHGGATIAAHATHVSFGLSLMNRWANEGGDPFVDADWKQAWKTPSVNDAEWSRIRDELRAETQQWLRALRAPRAVSAADLNNMIGSIAHLAYHLGAIRQIASPARGPKEGT